MNVYIYLRLVVTKSHTSGNMGACPNMNPAVEMGYQNSNFDSVQSYQKSLSDRSANHLLRVLHEYLHIFWVRYLH